MGLFGSSEREKKKKEAERGNELSSDEENHEVFQQLEKATLNQEKDG